tara:strand:+ start:305 stop:424 length:120 start_codon:yes stop_codon:yes gene_type:complete
MRKIWEWVEDMKVGGKWHERGMRGGGGSERERRSGMGEI